MDGWVHLSFSCWRRRVFCLPSPETWLAEAGTPQTCVRESREKPCPQVHVADFLLLLLVMGSQEVGCSQGIFDHAGLLTQQ